MPFPGCSQGAKVFICIFPIVCNSHNIHREGRYNYPYLQMNKLRQVKKPFYLSMCLLVPSPNSFGSPCSLTRLVIKLIFQRTKQARTTELVSLLLNSKRVLRLDRFAPSAGGGGHACVSVSPAPRRWKRPERSERSSEGRGWENPGALATWTQLPCGLGSRGVGSAASLGTAERCRKVLTANYSS